VESLYLGTVYAEVGRKQFSDTRWRQLLPAADRMLTAHNYAEAVSNSRLYACTHNRIHTKFIFALQADTLSTRSQRLTRLSVSGIVTLTVLHAFCHE
jgi:hypothetical protein